MKTYLYRVESGVICLYDPRWNGDKAHVDFIFPGDLVGLGFLQSHMLTARALVE
jgi:CRP/FNR family transcriptional regulator